MKFLCSNCKAKYQISDDKVVGRTLRMRCRACKEEIVIRGDAPSAAPAAPAPMSRPSAASVAPAPPSGASALGAGFQAQVQGGPVAEPAFTIDEWHVAINDIPVGPMRREEVGRKIEIGAVTPESLAWREGMDDWIPVQQIPDLSVLLARRGSVMPPVPQTAPVAAEPAMRASVAPIGGRQGAAPAPLDNWQAPPRESMAPMPSQMPTAPMQDASAAMGQRGWAPMFLAVCVFAFLMTALAIFGADWLRRSDDVAQAPQPPAAVAPIAPVAARPDPTLAAPEPEIEEMVIELDSLEIEDEGPKKRKTAKTTKAKGSTSTKSTGKNLTAAQRAMLEQMGGNIDGPATKLKQRKTASGTARGGTGQLTAGQLSKVVLKGRRNLQRCYETALRGSQSDETVRMDVKITVSASGNVTKVSTSGKGLQGMDKCITRTVRMWRFPSSANGAQTQFPVVFQPGG